MASYVPAGSNPTRFYDKQRESSDWARWLRRPATKSVAGKTEREDMERRIKSTEQPR